MGRPLNQLVRRYLVDGRDYELKTRGGEYVTARFDRVKLWFRVGGRGPVTLIDEILWVREIPSTNGGRQDRAWIRMDRWFLTPRAAKPQSSSHMAGATG